MRTLSILLLISLAYVVVPAQRKTAPPVVQEIATGTVSKQSSETTITNVFGFKKKPVVGELVTMIALGSYHPSIQLRIDTAELTENLCDESLPREWKVELGPVPEKNLFRALSPSVQNAEYFDLVILYPAVEFYWELSKKELNLATLPKGTSINTVKAAIDLDGDSRPDIVITEYCCLNRKKAPVNCDLTCGKTFKKVKNVWELVDTSAPC